MKTILSLVVLAFTAVGPARADIILWYNGDLPANGGATVNEQATSFFGSLNTYDDFNVTSPAGWTLDRIWSNDLMNVTGTTQAAWSVRSGVSVGNGGTVIASGTSPATQTPTGRTGAAVNFPEYTIEVTGLSIALSPGTYWLSVSPLVGNDTASGGLFDSYNSATVGANAIGTPPGNDANGLFNGPSLNDHFASFGNDYSMGVAGNINAAAIPEPSTIALLGFGALGWHGYTRWRKRPA
jgi:hypothetical protein